MVSGKKIMVDIKFKELKIESVSKSFPGVQALDNVSMKISAGKFTHLWEKMVLVNQLLLKF